MKVLVVDDSLLFRTVIKDLLVAMDGVSAVETASGGLEGLEKARDWRPDLITLDVDMPDISGLRVLRELKAQRNPAPVVVVSALTEAGTGVSLLASELGAIDILAKPRARQADAALEELRRQLKTVVAAVGLKRHPASHLARTPIRVTRPATQLPPQRPLAVVVGASTGGPSVIAGMVERLPPDFPLPLVVTLHLAHAFTRPFAEALASRGRIRVTEAEDGQALEPATLYLAPGGLQCGLARSADNLIRLAVLDDPPENDCKPSVDYLFRSAARVFGGRVAALILTGMGRDGVRGLADLRAAGAQVLAQDEDSSVVFGMPAAAIEAGLVDLVAPPARLVDHLVTLARATR
jgi:two-component system chemotaxis response regulator CheB